MRRNTTIVVVAALALLALFAMPLVTFAFAPAGTMGGWTWGTSMHGGWGGMTGDAPVWFALFGIVSQLAFFVLLGVGAYLLYRAVAADSTDPALEELRRAYARGDIDDDEYDRRRNRLENDT